MMNIPALRGHHLICLHFFSGAGYSAEFVTNLVSVIERLRTLPFELVEGADGVCASCSSLRDGVCHLEPGGETDIRRLDALALALLEVQPGMHLRFAEVRDRLPPILAHWRASACEECTWKDVCAPAIAIILSQNDPVEHHHDNPED